jgi:hypothetical protein
MEVAMFAQMFTGKVTDAEAVRAAFEGWPAGVGRDAKGWLGSTAGITDDGQLVALARFESEEAAHTSTVTQPSSTATRWTRTSSPTRTRRGSSR